MATAIGSFYFVRQLIPLRAGVVLFKTLLLSHFTFSAIFLKYLPNLSVQRINRQQKLSYYISHMRKKLESARDVLLTDKTLPAELFIE